MPDVPKREVRRIKNLLPGKDLTLPTCLNTLMTRLPSSRPASINYNQTSHEYESAYNTTAMRKTEKHALHNAYTTYEAQGPR